jgi:2-methylcitrate dehydratase PrpD
VTTKKTLVELQADWITDLAFEALPPQVIHIAKLCLLDFLGVAMRGKSLPQTYPVEALLSLHEGTESASVVGGRKTSVPYAALANGTYGHSCEFDDSHLHGGHPGVCVIPALLACAEGRAINGAQLITALVAGYQSMILSVGPIHRRTLELGWHGTKIGGVFGAAAAASKIMALSPSKTAHALAVAASDASGTMEYDQSGGEIKRFHAGLASRAGVEAAILAGAGLTGPRTIFEGKRGIHSLFSAGKSADVEKYPSDHFHILDTMFKLHPCAGTLHAAIDCVATICEQHNLTAEDIEKIEVGLIEWAIPHGAAIVTPTDAISAQFSLAFAIALRVVTGNSRIDDFLDPSLWQDPRIADIAHKVSPVAEATPDGADELFARVTIFSKSGSTFTHSQIGPRGFPSLPASDNDITDKFCSLTANILPETEANTLIDRIFSLEQQADVNFLFRALSLVA